MNRPIVLSPASAQVAEFRANLSPRLKDIVTEITKACTRESFTLLLEAVNHPSFDAASRQHRHQAVDLLERADGALKFIFWKTQLKKLSSDDFSKVVRLIYYMRRASSP